MSDILASIDKYRELIEDYADRMPRLLIRHPETADLALEIESLRLSDVLTSQFTVAVIGQMRSGKSTLINALIGRELTPIGIEETTATINWIRYAQRPEDEQIFRVHWKNGDVNDHPLRELNSWVGRSESAKETRYLEFFASSPFLKRATIVDTPGTRAVVKDHTTTASDFLAEKLERQTILHGGRADAVIYVINPVAREADLQQLIHYGDANRLPGSSPINSLCVAQKWEIFDDPVQEAKKKCDRLKIQFQDQVSDVLPTSGLLARTADSIDDDILTDLVRIVRDTVPETLSLMLMNEDFFCDPENSPVQETRRQEIVASVSWPALQLTLQLIRDRGLTEIENIRTVLLDVSGIKKLETALCERFFAQAEIIKASKLLRKAFEPFRRAQQKLQNVQQQYVLKREQGESILRQLQHSSSPAIKEARTFIDKAITSYSRDAREAKRLLTELAELQVRIQDCLETVDTDLRMRTTLLQSNFDPVELTELRTLLGERGQDAWSRLPEKMNGKSAAALHYAEERLTQWNGRMHRCRGDQKRICEVAVRRYSQILDSLAADH